MLGQAGQEYDFYKATKIYGTGISTGVFFCCLKIKGG